MSIDPRLDDVDYGAWTGLTPGEIEARWPNEISAYLADPSSVIFPGGESLSAASDRVWAAIRGLAATRQLGRTALVTHDAIIRLVVCRVLGAPASALHHVSVDLASTTALGRKGEEPTLEWLNATPERPCVWRHLAHVPSR